MKNIRSYEDFLNESIIKDHIEEFELFLENENINEDAGLAGALMAAASSMLSVNSMHTPGASDPIGLGTALAIIGGLTAIPVGAYIAAYSDDIKNSIKKWLKGRRLKQVDRDFSEEDLKEILTRIQTTYPSTYKAIRSNKSVDNISLLLKEIDIDKDIDPSYMKEFIKRLKEASRK